MFSNFVYFVTIPVFENFQNLTFTIRQSNSKNIRKMFKDIDLSIYDLDNDFAVRVSEIASRNTFSTKMTMITELPTWGLVTADRFEPWIHREPWWNTRLQYSNGPKPCFHRGHRDEHIDEETKK